MAVETIATQVNKKIMNQNKTKYKFTALLLLTVIVSHIFVFHFELEDKVLCIGEGDHFHIENIEDSHLASQYNLGTTENHSEIRDNHACADYLLDNHVDEDYAKIRKFIAYIVSKVISFDNSKLGKASLSSNRYLNFNRHINQKYITEQLPTTLLLI